MTHVTSAYSAFIENLLKEMTEKMFSLISHSIDNIWIGQQHQRNKIQSHSRSRQISLESKTRKFAF